MEPKRINRGPKNNVEHGRGPLSQDIVMLGLSCSYQVGPAAQSSPWSDFIDKN